ncbi:hypothetical protein [Helicobacter sp.]|uniref:hypothetical protein n=1 Tax=Helicobacter sp. TaxID=218 RepID=UPI0025C075F6|nr:hypothetical protein [Helicobacter sp.]MCI5633788.1 hypothetical protein [Helicobacter sp.]
MESQKNNFKSEILHYRFFTKAGKLTNANLRHDSTLKNRISLLKFHYLIFAHHYRLLHFVCNDEVGSLKQFHIMDCLASQEQSRIHLGFHS